MYRLRLLLIIFLIKLLCSCGEHESLNITSSDIKPRPLDDPFFIPNPVVKKDEAGDEPKDKDIAWPAINEPLNTPPTKHQGFIAWLKKEQVQGIFEDAVGVKKLSANNVYIFSSMEDAQHFKHKFLDEKTGQFGDVFFDRRLKHYVVPINEKAQNHLKSIYVQDHPLDSSDVDEQLRLLSVAKKKIESFNAAEISPTTTITRANYGQKIADRIAKTAELLRNGGDEGWYWHAAASAMDLLISIYRATHHHLLSGDERKILANAQKKVLEIDSQGRFSGGLKAHANFVGYVMEQYDDENDLRIRRQLIRDDVSLLLKGGYRKIIDRKTPPRIATIITTAQDPHSYKQPRFFPDDQGHSDTDTIVLQAGGMARHSAMNILTKIKDQNLPDGFAYYYKKIDAGAGAEDINHAHWTGHGIFTTEVKPYFQLKDLGNGQYAVKSDPKTGRALPLSGDEKINLDHDQKLYRRHMYATLFALLDAERQILFYRSPKLSIDWGEGKGITPKEATEWYYWDNKIKSLRGNPVPTLHKITPLQQSGNCTVFSAMLTVLALVGDDLGYDMLQSFKRLDKDSALASIDDLKAILLESKN